jgi:alkyl hydroperoxide reductase subunit AhpC
MRGNPWLACPAKWTVGAKTLKPSIKISGEIGEELSK